MLSCALADSPGALDGTCLYSTCSSWCCQTPQTLPWDPAPSFPPGGRNLGHGKEWGQGANQVCQG